MKSIKLSLTLVCFSILFSCAPKEQSKIVGTWRLYEVNSTMHTISYDSTLCTEFDLYEDDPMQYQFFNDDRLLYANLGACPIPAEATYKFENDKLTIQSGSITTELRILRLDDNILHWQRNTFQVYTVEKFIRE